MSDSVHDFESIGNVSAQLYKAPWPATELIDTIRKGRYREQPRGHIRALTPDERREFANCMEKLRLNRQLLAYTVATVVGTNDNDEAQTRRITKYHFLLRGREFAHESPATRLRILAELVGIIDTPTPTYVFVCRIKRPQKDCVPEILSLPAILI